MAIRDRLKDAPWYNKINNTILVGGVGGIGSWVSFLLARAGFQIYVFDPDIIEQHNIGGQLYQLGQVGKRKVDALQDIIRSFSDIYILKDASSVTRDSISASRCISAFDNMQARKDMFEKWKETTPINGIFIDGRLEAEYMKIFCIEASNSTSIDRYINEELSVTDAEIPDAPCTMKQTSHSAAMIASHMVGFFTNHVTNVVEKDNSREVPYSWEYFIPINLLNNERAT